MVPIEKVRDIITRHDDLEKELSIIDVFLNTDFEGGRHQRRVDKISC